MAGSCVAPPCSIGGIRSAHRRSRWAISTLAGEVVALLEQADQQVLGAEVVVAEPPRLHPGQPGGMTGCPGDVHWPGDWLHGGLPPLPGAAAGAVFWWTACLVTPRRLAMSCQDQPLARALSTWRASSTSSRPRRAATARRPSSGSRLLAAARVTASGSTVFSVSSRNLTRRQGQDFLTRLHQPAAA